MARALQGSRDTGGDPVRDERSHVSQRLLAPGPVVAQEEALDLSAGLRRVCPSVLARLLPRERRYLPAPRALTCQSPTSCGPTVRRFGVCFLLGVICHLLFGSAASVSQPLRGKHLADEGGTMRPEARRARGWRPRRPAATTMTDTSPA